MSKNLIFRRLKMHKKRLPVSFDVKDLRLEGTFTVLCDYFRL
jgi:hypothetical protein